MATDAYHGYATESDYHEHYTLEGMLDQTRNRIERKAIMTQISEILDRRIYAEIRTVRSA